MIEPSGVVKTGPYSVQFRLKAPNNAFPYLVSQTTYQAIIQPAAIAARARHVGVERDDRDGPVPAQEPEQAACGARALQQLLGRPASARRGRDHVLRRPGADGARAARRPARPRRADVAAAGASVQEQQQVPASTPCRSRRTTCSGCGSTATRSGTPACAGRSRSRSTGPTSSTGSCSVPGALGNDSPFFPSSRRPTRRSSSASRTSSSPGRSSRRRARRTSKFTITTHNQFDVPDYAAAIQAAGRQAGIDIDLDVMTYDDYYAAVGGGDYDATTPWLNATATITEYGARGVPNLYLTAAYMTDGIWNASKYSNAAFDSAARTYLALGRHRGAAEGDEEDGGAPPARHAGDHRVLPRLHGAPVDQGAELRGRSDLAHPCRQDVARLEERTGRPEPDSGRPPTTEPMAPLRREAARPRRDHARPAEHDRVRRGAAPAGRRRPLRARPRRDAPRRSTSTTRSTAPTGRRWSSTSTGRAASCAATSATRSSRPSSPSGTHPARAR